MPKIVDVCIRWRATSSLASPSIPSQEQSSEPAASNETTNDSVVAGNEEAANVVAESPKKESPPAVEKDKENDTGVRSVISALQG